MNLLCPNCQKMLTVPEQYAGQLMKCPLCAGTFTVPGLPSAPSAAPPAETYSVRSEPAPTAAAAPPTTPAASGPASASASFTPTPPPPPPPGGPLTFSVWFKPEVVQWIAPGAVILILFFILFFPWIGVYPGGQPAAWQYAWQMPFGLKSDDPDLQQDPELRKEFHFTTAQEIAEASKEEPVVDNRPGFDLLMLLYLPFFLLTAVITIGCALLPLVSAKLPPNLAPILAWRWGIVAALNFLVFFVMCVHLIWGFSMESNLYTWKTSQPAFVKLAKKEPRNTIEEKTLTAMKGQASDLVTRTIYLKLAFFLHFVAIASAALTLGLDRRGNKPPVRLDLVL